MYSKVFTEEMRDKKRGEGSIFQFSKYHGFFDYLLIWCLFCFFSWPHEPMRFSSCHQPFLKASLPMSPTFETWEPSLAPSCFSPLSCKPASLSSVLFCFYHCTLGANEKKTAGLPHHVWLYVTLIDWNIQNCIFKGF